MIEPEDNDRWRSLAEELGLPPTSEDAPSPADAVVRSEQPRSARAEPDPVKAEEYAESTPAEQERPARGRRRRGRSADRAESKAETAGGEASLPTSEAPGEEERHRRRRRRRGSKSSTSSELETTGEETTEESSASVEEKETDSGERPRRRRRRRVKKAELEGETVDVVESEEDREEVVEEEPIRVEEEDDDEEAEDFSTWNVPSWAEIIAGLYRPER
jgi:ribonuclease E